MKDKDKFIVAHKDISQPGQIKQGKVLGRYRKREFAERAKPNLARQENVPNYYLGIWHNGRLVS